MANRFLNNIRINDAYTFPASDGTSGQIITTDGAGVLSFDDPADGSTIILTVKNVSGGTLSKGTVVHVHPTATPPSGNVLEVIAADNTSASTMPAVGVLNSTLANTAEGQAVAFGALSGIDTSSFTAGDEVFVGVSGALTTTKPTGTNYIQKIAVVVKSHATNGSIEIFGAGRTNDVPAPLYVDVPNGRVGVGTTSQTEKLEVAGNIILDASNANLKIKSGVTGTKGDIQWTFNSDSTAYASAGIEYDNRTTDGFLIDSGYPITLDYASNYIRFSNNGNEKMRINTSGNVGIGTTSPSVKLDVSSTDAIKIPSGTTAQRPTGANGMLRYNSDDGQFEGYAAGAWGAIAGSGGGSGTSTIYRETFSGDGSTTTFTLSNSIADEANTQVYVNGVYQSKLNYSTSGTSLTFASAPNTGSNNIEVVHIASVTVDAASGLNKNTFIGDGSTVAFTLSAEPSTEDFTFVFIQGVYQEKSTYSVSGTTLTFTTAPQNGYSVEVMHIGAVNTQQTNYLAYDTFTGDNSTTSFTLVNGAPTAKEFTMIFLDGVYQAKANYSLTSGAIVFSTAPPNNVAIEIASINGGGINIATVEPDVDVNDVKYSVSVISADTTAVSGYVYVFTAALTLTLPALPGIGDSIKISNRSGTTTCVLGRNGNNIMGSATDLTIDTENAGFEIIYSGAAEGWIIIGN